MTEKSNIIPIHVKLFLLNNEFLSCYNIHMLEYNTNILKYTFKDFNNIEDKCNKTLLYHSNF